MLFVVSTYTCSQNFLYHRKTRGLEKGLFAKSRTKAVFFLEIFRLLVFN